MRSPSQALTESPPAEDGPGRAAEGRAGTGQVDRFHPEVGDHTQDVSVHPLCAQHLGPLPGAWDKTTALTHSGVLTRRCGFISTSQVRPQEVLANSQGLASTTSGTCSPTPQNQGFFHNPHLPPGMASRHVRTFNLKNVTCCNPPGICSSCTLL